MREIATYVKSALLVCVLAIAADALLGTAVMAAVCEGEGTGCHIIINGKDFHMKQVEEP